MDKFSIYSSSISDKGFAVIKHVFSSEEIGQMEEVMNKVDTARACFRKSADLFAIRQFLKEVPEILPVVFNEKLRTIVANLFGKEYFVVKSIYFDKPQTSNWYVAWHQDLTISVDQKISWEGFGPWTVKQDQYAVQPPLHILQNNFTIRIHLDDTDDNNGALKVIEGSHKAGIHRPETIAAERIVSCHVPSGGIMIMKPLLMHSSARTTNQKRRRVIHIEFSNTELPSPLNWSEKILDFVFV